MTLLSNGLEEIQNPVYCVACKEREFVVSVTETKIIMTCVHCGWKIEVNVK